MRSLKLLEAPQKLPRLLCIVPVSFQFRDDFTLGANVLSARDDVVLRLLQVIEDHLTICHRQLPGTRSADSMLLAARHRHRFPDPVLVGDLGAML
jgi:hypothetical protein